MLGRYLAPNIALGQAKDAIEAMEKQINVPAVKPVAASERNRFVDAIMSKTLSGPANIEPKLPNEQTTSLRRRAPIWPYAWLALVGIATVGWALALGWVAIILGRLLWASRIVGSLPPSPKGSRPIGQR
jgi:hypothetical protein